MLTATDLQSTLRLSASSIRRHVRSGALPKGTRLGTVWDAAAVSQAIASHGHLQTLATMSRKAALQCVPLTDDPAALSRYADHLRAKGDDGLAAMLPGSLYPVAAALVPAHCLTFTLQELARWNRDLAPCRIEAEALYRAIMTARTEGQSQLTNGPAPGGKVALVVLAVHHRDTATVAVAVDAVYCRNGKPFLAEAWPSLRVQTPKRLQSWAARQLAEPVTECPTALDWHRLLQVAG
jgi:hypothetical protein